LPRQDDHSDGPSTLPPPELNPLLNPILGQNMGRWAEVYFTSPPEKREQAVLDLLRELQGENPAPEAPAAGSEQESQPFAAPASRQAEDRAPLVRCGACGRENPASHRFCGMCGTPIGEPRAAVDLNVTDVHVVDIPGAARDVADDATDFQNAEQSPASEVRPIAHLFAEQPAPLVQTHEPGFILSEDVVSQSAAQANDFLPARGREFDERDDKLNNLFQPVRASRPYGLYAGIAVVFVLALAYVAWRSLQPSRMAFQAPPAAVTQPETPAQAQPNPENANTPSSVSGTPALAPPANTQAVAPPNNAANDPANDASIARSADPLSHADGAKTASLDAATQPASPNAAIDEKSLQAEPVSANGAQELAIAQNYLNLKGAEGQQRNSAEAAKWLWKAIAKHNADATLLLSDLYLKGDGVEKNCDQARVLLDAAAGRGMRGAGERLRNLQAFGCQ
jgi:hypothetical protein